jgi:nitrogen-specific signal transduction histidine kinase/CheY-like chemotaxis protein
MIEQDMVQQLFEIFNNVKSGIAIFEPVDQNTNFIFKSINKSVEVIEKVSPEYLIGKRITTAFPCIEKFGLLEVMQRVSSTGKSEILKAKLYTDKRISGWRENYVCRLSSGYIVNIYEDMTEKKDLEMQFFQSQKLESLGILSSGIAHDFNNILMAISGAACLIQMTPEVQPFISDEIKQIESSIEHAVRLTKQLLGFSRNNLSQASYLDVNTLVKDSLDIFTRTNKCITIKENYCDKLPSIKVDSTQIEQVLLNLYVNASHAMNNDGILTINTGVILNEVFISVRDTGHGIPKEIQHKIFEPFFTTKEQGKGTGLGLSSSYGIIKNHNGRITVDSVINEFSEFTIYLPAVWSNSLKRDVITSSVQYGKGTLLVIDDEINILKTIISMLQHLGYTVIGAQTYQEAVNSYSKFEIDLILLDMVMLNKDSIKLFKFIRSMNYSAKIISMTGDISLSDDFNEIINECNSSILKPFTAQKLSEVIFNVLHDIK